MISKGPATRFASTFVGMQRPRTRPRTQSVYRHSGMFESRIRQEVEAVVASEEVAPSIPTTSFVEEPGTVLIVDDQTINRVVLSRLVSRAGHAFHTAGCGEQALEFVEKYPSIELVLLDLYMPGMSGLEVVERIRSQPKHRLLGIILVTASEETDDVVMGLESGADDFLVKPVNPRVLLARVGNVMRMRRMERQLARSYEELRSDLTAAQEVQSDIIPRSPLWLGATEVSWRYIPSLFVGGDVLDVGQPDDEHLVFYLADVSGHGVAAAMLGFWLHDALSPMFRREDAGGSSAQARHSLSGVLAELDERIAVSPVDRYCTAVLGRIHLSTGRLEYCVAGHPRPVILSAEGQPRYLETGGTPVGMGLGLPFETFSTSLHSGDRLFLCTDGILEAADRTAKQYGEERLERQLRITMRQPLEKQLDGVVRNVLDWSGSATFDDDVTLLGLRFGQ